MLPSLDPTIERYPEFDPRQHVTPKHARKAFRSPKPPTQGRLHDAVFSGGRLARDGKRPPRVKLYRNGDKFFEGKSVLLNEPAHDLEHWLEKITPRMGFGALRRIYTHDGKRIRQLNQLVDGSSYVVARQERYKKVKYTGIVDVRTRELQYRQKRVMILKKRPQPHTIHGLSGKLGEFDVKGRIADVLKQTKPKTVYLIRNGDDRNVCVPMLLTQRNARDFNQVCQRISNRLQLEAPCRAIYNISGAPITELSELMHGLTYVAVGRIAFTQVGYKPAPPARKMGRKQNKQKNVLGVHGQGKGGHGDLKSMIQKKLKVAEIVGRLGRTDTREAAGQDPSQKMTNAEAAAGGKVAKNRKISPYTVTVFTGKEKNMGTTARVLITVYGELGDSGKRDLWEDERNFKATAEDQFIIEVPRLGDIERIVLEHDGTGEEDEDNEWYCDHVEIRDDESGGGAGSGDAGGAIKKFFWVNQWIKMPPPYIGDEPEGGWPPRKAMVEVNGTLCMDSESAAAEAKALASGMSAGQMKQQSQAFTALEARLLTICKDKQQTKRLWRQLAAESGSSSNVPLHAFWELCSDNFPILNNMSARMRAFNRTIFKANIDGDNKVGKHTFRLLLLNTLYFCRVYSVFDTDEDGSSDADMSLEIVKEKIPFLGINMDDEEMVKEYEVMKNTSGGMNDTDVGDDVTLDDFCVWYSSRKVPKDVKDEAANAEDKQKKKEEKKLKKKQKKKEKAAAIIALEKVANNPAMLVPGELKMDTSGDGVKDTMVTVDTDGDGIANVIMMDTDGDGSLDVVIAIPGQEQMGPSAEQIAAHPKTPPPYDPNDRVEKHAWEAGEKVAEFEKASAMEGARAEMRAIIAKEEAVKKSTEDAVKASLSKDAAATRIQAGYRGMKGRQKAKKAKAARAAGTDGSTLKASELKGFRNKLGAVRKMHPENMVAKHFNDAAYHRIESEGSKEEATKKQGELEACVMPALEHPTAAIGVFALDSTDYDRFTETFDPIVRDVHGVGADVTHSSNLEIKSDTLDLSTVELNVVSIGIEARRNVQGMPLSGGMTANQRLELEMKLVPAFEMFKELPDFGGRYYSMTTENPDHIDEAAWENMRTADGERAMPKDLSDDPVLVTAGMASDYPKGRGCYMSDDGETIIWVGGEDHLRIACVKEGKSNAFNDVFDNLRMILDIFAGFEDLTFAESKKYGFITSSPQYVGTAMRAFANVQVPHLIADGLEPAAKIAEPLGLKVSKKTAQDEPTSKSAANREPVEGRCQVSVNAKFGVSEADEATKLLTGLKALADGEKNLAGDKGVPHVMVSTDTSDGLAKDLAAAAAEDANAEKKPEDDAHDKQDHIASPEKRRDSAPMNVGVPISWDQLEENVKKLPDNPEMMNSMWESMNLGDTPASMEQLLNLLKEIDLRLGASKEPLQRAFSSIIDHEATTITIQQSEYYSMVAGSFYFARLFSEFPDAESNRDKKLDLVGFQDAVKKIPFEEPPTDLASTFDAMESNDGGLISFDDFAVWYIGTVCPRAVSGLGAPM